MPKVEVHYNGIVLWLKSLPVCESVKCRDAEPPMGLGSLFKTGGVGWEFEWHPIQHGVAECLNCGAWHQIYHWRDEEWPDAPVEGKLHKGGWTYADDVGDESKRRPDRWLYVFAEIVDTRPEHYEGGRLPERLVGSGT